MNCALLGDTPSFVRRNQGGWFTTRSAYHYWIRLNEHANAVVKAVYDTDAIPSPLIDNLFAQDSINQQHPAGISHATVHPTRHSSHPVAPPPVPDPPSSGILRRPRNLSTQVWTMERRAALRETVTQERAKLHDLQPTFAPWDNAPRHASPRKQYTRPLHLIEHLATTTSHRKPSANKRTRYLTTLLTELIPLRSVTSPQSIHPHRAAPGTKASATALYELHTDEVLNKQ